MNFNAYIPSKLTGIVELIWEQKMANPGRVTILPSGKVELIFPVHPIKSLEALKMNAQDNPINNYTCFLSGLHTKPLEMTFDKFHVFGVQMKPVAVKALFGMPLCEIRNYYLEGSLVFETIAIIEELLHSKSDFLERAQWFENFLLKKINETAELHQAINLDKIINKQFIQKPMGSYPSIQDIMGYSRTQTYRLFNEWFGVSAHSYQMLLQFIQSVETLHLNDLNLNDAGLKNGYYDQAHFIHTFQKFSDMTPGEYRKKMSSMPGQLFK